MNNESVDSEKIIESKEGKDKTIPSLDIGSIDWVYRFREEIPQTKEELNCYLIYYYGFHLASKPIDEGNSCPLDFVWHLFSVALGLKKDVKIEDYNILGMSARNSQKSLSCAAFELLAITFDKDRNYFHMASIYEQSRVTYGYVQNVLNKPLLKDISKKSIMRETISKNGNILKIGTGTIKNVNSYHGCIYAKSLINLSTVSTSIDRLSQQRYKPNFIESIPSYKKFSAIKYSGKKECIKIIAKNGLEIILTPNHELLHFDLNGNFVRRAASSFNKEDTIYLKINGGFPKSRIRFYRSFKKKIKNKYLLNKNNFDNLCYFSGLMLGDGFVTNDEIYLGMGYEVNFSKIEDLFVSISGLSKDKYRIEKKEINSQILRCKDESFIEDLNKIELNFIDSKSKKIPSFILSSPKESFYNFLAGYFDSDGSPQIKEIKNTDVYYNSYLINFYSCNKELLQSLQFILLRDGLVGAIYSTKNKGCDQHTLTFNGSDASYLANKIIKFTKLDKTHHKFKNLKIISEQFVSQPNKSPSIEANLINKLLSKIKTKHHSLVKSFLSDPLYSEKGIKKNKNFVFSDDREVTFLSINNFLKSFYECYYIKEWQSLYNLTHSNLYPVKIKEIKNYGLADVYDVQVEDGDQYWCPNGFVVGNSVISDEVDLTDRKVFIESKGMLAPGSNSKSAIDVKISSRKFAFGNIQSLLDKKEKESSYPLKIFKWGQLEVTQKCSAERSITEEKTEDIYVYEEDLHAISPNEFYKIKDIITRDKYEKMKGYPGCLPCGIFSFCKGNLKKQVEDNPFLVPIDDVVRLFNTDDKEFFKSQRLNRKPSQSGMIFGSWNPYKQALSYEAIYQIFTGKEWQEDENIKKEELIQLMISNGCRAYLGIDFGFNVAVALLIMKDGSDRFYVLDQVLAETKSDADFARMCWDRWGKISITKGYGDIASPGGIMEFARYFSMLEPSLSGTTDSTYKAFCKLSKNYDYKFGLMRKLISSPGTKAVRFYCYSGVSEIIDYIGSYRYHVDTRTDEIHPYPADGQRDHGIDGLLHGLCGIEIAGGGGVQMVVVSTEPKGKEDRIVAPNPYELSMMQNNPNFIENNDAMPSRSLPIDPNTGNPLVSAQDNLKKDPNERGSKKFRFTFV